MKRFIIFSFTFGFLLSAQTQAQLAGNGVYQFLNMPVSARVAALGGATVPVKDADANLAIFNPAAYNPEMSNQFTFSNVSYFADINYGYAGYTRATDSIGTFHAGLQYLRYGNFTAADASGQQQGTFTAGEYALNLGWGKSLDSCFSVGMNVKGIYSNLQTVTSTGITADLAAMYQNDKSNFSAVLLLRNLGTQIKPYTEGNKEPLPTEVQLGIAKKLGKAPFRFSVLLQHLEKFDLTYTKPQDPSANTNYFGDNLSTETSSDNFDKVMRHVVLGAEVLLSKNFHIRIGYNYKRRQELQLADKTGGVGFSWGFGLRISKFNISYGRATYHLAGASNVFTISTNFSDFAKKSKQ